MVKIQRRIQGGLAVLQYYTTKQWVFRNDNLKALPQSLTEQDKQTFYTDIKMVDWNGYIKNFVLGTRHYCLKEDPATLPKARSHLRRLYWLDRTVSALFYFLVVWMILYWSDHIVACGRLAILSIHQVFRMMPILRALPEMVETDTGTTS